MARNYRFDVEDALRGKRFPRQPKSFQVERVFSDVITRHPRMSCRQQTLAEMRIRDEIARRAGNRVR